MKPSKQQGALVFGKLGVQDRCFLGIGTRRCLKGNTHQPLLVELLLTLRYICSPLMKMTVR